MKSKWLASLAVGITLLNGIARAEVSGARDLSNDGWRLWLDPQAAWQDDKGQIVVLCLPGLMSSIAKPAEYQGIHPVTARRLLYNALK